MGRSGRLVTGRKVAGSNPGSPGLNCVSVLEQDTEPQIAPDMHSPCDEPCEGPVMSWRLVQAVPSLCPETAGIGSSKTPRDPIKSIKQLQTMT